MAINYNFIAYCSKISPTDWIIGMRSIHGEVPLDVVIPDGDVPSDPDNPELIGVLTTEGLERESKDGLELYRYLRQLNPRKNESFSYNEIVIRNIHGRITALKVDEELRVQVTYTQRKEAYKLFSYQIKLLGIFPNSGTDGTDISDDEASDIATSQPSPKNTLPGIENPTGSGLRQEGYKTTNTLEKLIAFTQNLQQELKEAKRELTETTDRIERLENEWQDFSAIQDLVQEILDRLRRLESLNSRVQNLEADQHQLHNLQQLLRKFLVALNQQIRVTLEEQDDQSSTSTTQA